MPPVQPTFGDSYGVREGDTGLMGSLAPVIAPGFETRIAADIGAFPPVGLIYTRVRAGFNAGAPPRAASTIFVSVVGTGTISKALIQVAGPAYARAHAELSITFEEWAPRVPRFSRPPFSSVLVQRVTFNPTKIFDVWGTFPLSFQFPTDDGTTYTSVAGMPISEIASVRGHFFHCWINLIQTAEADAVVGYAAAVSNVAYDFPPPFVAFL